MLYFLQGISNKGENCIFKCGIGLLYGALTHLLLAMFWDDYMFVEKLKVKGNAIEHTFSNINENFWILFYSELTLALVLIVFSFIIKKEPK